jgi:hypothetical protein
MIHVECSRWEQTPEDLRRAGIEAIHPRTRERFAALYEMTQTGCAAPRHGDGRTHLDHALAVGASLQ